MHSASFTSFSMLITTCPFILSVDTFLSYWLPWMTTHWAHDPEQRGSLHRTSVEIKQRLASVRAGSAASAAAAAPAFTCALCARSSPAVTAVLAMCACADGQCNDSLCDKCWAVVKACQRCGTEPTSLVTM
jgi:hypothetical protein